VPISAGQLLGQSIDEPGDAAN